MMCRCSPTHPALRLQGVRVDLVDVVDLGGRVVVFAVTNDVDQVVVGEVWDDVGEVRARPGEKKKKKTPLS